MFKVNRLAWLIMLGSVAETSVAVAYTPVVNVGEVVNDEVIDAPDSNSVAQNVYGTVNNTHILSGIQWLHGAVSNGALVQGQQWLDSGSISNAPTVMSGGGLSVADSVVNDAVIQSGGLAVLNGDKLWGATDDAEMNRTVLNGGTLLNRTGIDRDTVVNAGGLLQTGLGGGGLFFGVHTALSFNAVVNEGGVQSVDNGGTSYNSLISSGGELLVNYSHIGGSPEHPEPAWGTAIQSVVYGTMRNQGGLDDGTVIKEGAIYTAGYLDDVDVIEGVSHSTGAIMDGSAYLYNNSLAEGWSVGATGVVELSSSTATIADSALNGGRLYLKEGTALNTLVNGGEFWNLGGYDNNTIVNNGGVYHMGGEAGEKVGGGGLPSSNNLNIGVDSRAYILGGVLTGSTVVDGQMSLGGSADGVTAAATLQGNMFVSKTGSLIVSDKVVSNEANVNLEGKIFLDRAEDSLGRGEYHFDSFKTTGGEVVFDRVAGGYSTLTLGSLEGSGQFWMNTDLSTLQGDLIRVEGQTLGDHILVVEDSGKEPLAPGGHLTLVNGNGGDGTFTLAGGHVDAGAYRYTLAKEDQDWVLGNDEPVKPKPEELSKGTNAAVATQTARAGLWAAENDTLIQRLGELRLGKDAGGVWVRTMNNSFKFDNGNSRAFDQSIDGLQVGADKTIDRAAGTLRVGALFGASTSKQNFGEGAKGSIESKTVGGYATYLQDDGIYIDMVAKMGRSDTEVKTPTNLGRSVKGSFENNAYGVSVEGGKRFTLDDNWFVEPQVQISTARIEGGGYTDSNGLKVRYDAINTLQSRVGAMVGKGFQLDRGVTVQPYAKLSWITEHAGASQVAVNDIKLKSELVGDRGVLGFGAALKAGDSRISLDAEYSKGNGVMEPWTINLGYRYSM